MVEITGEKKFKIFFCDGEIADYTPDLPCDQVHNIYNWYVLQHTRELEVSILGEKYFQSYTPLSN